MYVVVSIFLLMLSNQQEFLTQIVVYSVGGFFAFFMGFFGYNLAQQVTVYFTDKIKKR